MAAQNAIEILLTLQDRMSDGLRAASGKLSGFADQVKAGAVSAAGLGTALGIAGTAATAAAGAVTVFAAKLADQVKQLDNLSQQSGISTDRLQVLQFAFRDAGLDVNSLQQALTFMSRAIDTNSAKLRSLGVDAKDPFEAFQQLTVVIANMSDVHERNSLAMEVFGKAGAQAIPVLNKLANEYGSVEKAARDTGNVISGVSVASMLALNASVDRLTQNLEGLGKRGLIALAPAIGSVTDAANKLLTVIEKLNHNRWLVDLAVRLSGATARGPAVAQPGAREGAMAAFPSFEAFQAAQQKAIEEMFSAYDRDQAFRGSLANRAFSAGGSKSDFLLGGALRGVPNLREQLGVDFMVQELPTILDEAGRRFLEFSNKVEGSFKRIGESVYNGFYAVLTNLTNKTQTFKSAMKTLWDAIVQGILSAMAHLVASAITKAFLRILGIALSALTGNPVFAAAGSSAAAAVPFVAGPVPGGATDSLRGGGGNTFIIQTINAKDALQSIVSPTGQMRAANSRLREVAAVG